MNKVVVAKVRSTAEPARNTRRYGGMMIEDRVSERRQRLVDAGLECFGTRGYHGITVRELCAQAGLTERYFYESFKDREALFAAVYQDVVARLRASFLAAAAAHAPDLENMARAGLGVFFRLLKRDPRVSRMLLVEVLTVSREMERQAQGATFGFGDLLRQMTRATIPGSPAAAPQPKQDLDLVAAGLIGSSIHIAMRWTYGGCRQSVNTVIETAMTFFRSTIEELGGAGTGR